MPNIRIETNVAKEKIKDLPGFLKELSSALAATTGKPEQYMVVQVNFLWIKGRWVALHPKIG